MEQFNSAGCCYFGTIPQLVSIQQALYQAVKGADPNALVISPTVTGTWVGGAATYNTFLADGGGAWFDIAGIHGYVDQYGETIVTSISQFRAVLQANNLSAVPIIDTEGSWQPNTLGDDTLQIAFTMKTLALEYWMGVSRKVWYAFDTDPTQGPGYLVSPVHTSTLTNAGTAFVTTSGWLTGATIADYFQLNDGTIWYGDLTRSGGIINPALSGSIRSQKV